MNAVDFHALLTAQPISRTTFFTQLLVVPRPQSELHVHELANDGAPELVAPVAATVSPLAGSFPA